MKYSKILRHVGSSDMRNTHVKKLAEKKRTEKLIETLKSDWKSELEEGMQTVNVYQKLGDTSEDGELEDHVIDTTIEASFEDGPVNGLQNMMFKQTMLSDGGSGSGDNGGFNIGKHLKFGGTTSSDGRHYVSTESRHALLKPIDARNIDTITVTAIRGNDSNGGELPDYHWEDLTLMWFNADPNGYGGVGSWGGIDFDRDGNHHWQTNKIIIPVVSGDSSGYDISAPDAYPALRDWTIEIPEWCKNKNQRFGLYQQKHSGYGYDHYGITQIKYRARAPMNAFVALDKPEASSFVRLGPTSSSSPKKRKKKLEDQLKASKKYTEIAIGKDFPGMGATLDDTESASPIGSEELKAKHKEAGTLAQQLKKALSPDDPDAPKDSKTLEAIKAAAADNAKEKIASIGETEPIPDMKSSSFDEDGVPEDMPDKLEDYVKDLIDSLPEGWNIQTGVSSVDSEGKHSYTGRYFAHRRGDNSSLYSKEDVRGGNRYLPTLQWSVMTPEYKLVTKTYTGSYKTGEEYLQAEEANFSSWYPIKEIQDIVGEDYFKIVENKRYPYRDLQYTGPQKSYSSYVDASELYGLYTKYPYDSKTGGFIGNQDEINKAIEGYKKVTMIYWDNWQRIEGEFKPLINEIRSHRDSQFHAIRDNSVPLLIEAKKELLDTLNGYYKEWHNNPDNYTMEKRFGEMVRVYRDGYVEDKKALKRQLYTAYYAKENKVAAFAAAIDSEAEQKLFELKKLKLIEEAKVVKMMNDALISDPASTVYDPDFDTGDDEGDDEGDDQGGVSEEDEKWLNDWETRTEWLGFFEKLNISLDFARMAIQYARGDNTPWKKFDPVLERQTLAISERAFKKELAAGRDPDKLQLDYKHWGFSTGTLSLGTFTVHKTDLQGNRLPDGKYRIEDLFDVEKTFKTVGQWGALVPGLQGMADRIVRIAHQRRGIDPKDPGYGGGGIDIDIIIGSTKSQKVRKALSVNEPIVRSSSPTSKSNKKKRRKKSNYVESKKFVGRNRVFGSLNVSDMKKTLQNKMEIDQLMFEKNYDDIEESIKKKEDQMSRLKKIRKTFDYEGKPSPDGFPDNDPPELDPKTGMHPEYGKNAKRYKKLDPISARSMPKTGDPETDAEVAKAAKKPK